MAIFNKKETKATFVKAEKLYIYHTETFCKNNISLQKKCNCQLLKNFLKGNNLVKKITIDVVLQKQRQVYTLMFCINNCNDIKNCFLSVLSQMGSQKQI